MSKIAVILSGYFRTFDYVKDTFTNRILNKLDIDIFFSTPHTVFSPPDDEVKEYHHIHSQNNNLVYPNIINYFGTKLKKYELRDSKQSEWRAIISSNGMTEKNIHNQYHWRTLAQIYGISISMKLFKQYTEENNIQYDLVILTRPDMKYYTDFNISNIHMDKINYQTHCMTGNKLSILAPTSGPSPSLNRAFNDQILAGAQNKMLVFATAYDSIIQYHKEGICFNTETLLGIHCIKNNIDFIGSNYILYELWRDCSFDTNIGFRPNA